MSQREEHNTQWHQAFRSAFRLELGDEKDKLVISDEEIINIGALQADILVVKKDRNTKIHRRIGEIFEAYNIIEYKSPEDEAGVLAYYKVLGYACMYMYHHKIEDVTDMTVTLIREGEPRKLMTVLEKRGYVRERRTEGIAYFSKKGLPKLQIIVTSLGEFEDYPWLKAITKKLETRTAVRLLETYEQIPAKEKELVDAVMEVIVPENLEVFENIKKEGKKVMCEAVFEIPFIKEELERRMTEQQAQYEAELAEKQEEIEELRSLLDQKKDTF